MNNMNITLEKKSNSREKLIEKYISIRKRTNEICNKIEIEDQVVQPCSEVSPPKWHLGHTTWFFEELILVRFSKDFFRFNDRYRMLFNSYYKSSGKHWLQSERGYLSRPRVSEVLKYRRDVDEKIIEFLQNSDSNSEIDFLLELGLQHEQQHQELLYMDIKFIFGVNPLLPLYAETSLNKAQGVPDQWRDFKEGIYEIGHNGFGFAYDNEGPKHKTYIYPFRICENTVTNGDYLEFIEDNGYAKPQFWLSQGWDWVNDNRISGPLYWCKEGDTWYEYTLHGLQPLDHYAPVTHISYFEADAFANWTGLRLPTEEESETFLREISEEKLSFNACCLHPTRADIHVGQVWCWTKSHYSPYPGYRRFEGMLEEYNGKFMCNQFVLKGGCVVTPQEHYRHSYRNFYQPQQRWMFSGIRLAKDL